MRYVLDVPGPRVHEPLDRGERAAGQLLVLTGRSGDRLAETALREDLEPRVLDRLPGLRVVGTAAVEGLGSVRSLASRNDVPPWERADA